MAKKAKTSAETEAEGAVPEAAETGPRRRKLALLIGAALLVVGLAGAGAHRFGLLDRIFGGDEAAEAESKHIAAEPVFYPLPDLLVSLNTGERRSTFLKVKLTLQLVDATDQPRVDRMLPRILDYCQVYLRELRLDEVRGSAGTARLREELLRRIAAALAPVAVTDVLFGELFVQ
jgi:flagellar FliL protein